MHQRRRERLEAMVSYLEKGHQPSFQELRVLVHEKFSPIQVRQLRMDIQYLRETGLEHGPLNLRIKGGRYQLLNEQKFDFSNLLQAEKVTLPLVFAALQPFERFPSVKAVLNNLIRIHKLNRKEVKMLGAAIGSHQVPMNELFVDRIISIMQAIHQEKAIEFNYYKVDQGAISPENSEIVYRVVYPLQIRVFDGRYYLVGLRTEREALASQVEYFPIDRIHRRVDFSVDETTHESIVFNWEALAASLDLESLFTHRIGMYRGNLDEKPRWVYRWFKGWAASIVQAVPLHPSQEIVDNRGGDIRIRLTLVPTPDLDNTFRKFGEFCWEGDYERQ